MSARTGWGEKLFRTLYWYPGGRMTPARETDHDLVERIDAVPIATVRVARTTADAITARTRVDLFGFEQDRKIDKYLDDKEWF